MPPPASAAPAAAAAPAATAAASAPAQPALRKLIISALTTAPTRGISTTALQELLKDKATKPQLMEALNTLVLGREAELLRPAGPASAASVVFVKLVPTERVAKIRDLTVRAHCCRLALRALRSRCAGRRRHEAACSVQRKEGRRRRTAVIYQQ